MTEVRRIVRDNEMLDGLSIDRCRVRVRVRRVRRIRPVNPNEPRTLGPRLGVPCDREEASESEVKERAYSRWRVVFSQCGRAALYAPAVLFVSLRDLQWRRRRFLIGVLATGLVFALTVVMSGVNASFHNEINRTVNAFAADKWIVPADVSGPFTSTARVPHGRGGEDQGESRASNVAEAGRVLPRHREDESTSRT